MEEESLNIFPPSNSLSIDKIVFDKEPIINNNINILQVKNIILIDKTVQQSDIFFNSSNENTLAICYNSYTEREKLLDYLKSNFTTLDRIALVFDNSMMNNKIFLNEQSFFTEDDLTLFENNKDDPNNYSNNVSFILEILKTFQVKNIDFLACQSLEYTTWKKYYELLHYYTQTIVGASNDLTGNINYGGDWIMETTNEDIQNMYFNNNITNYSLTLLLNPTIVFPNITKTYNNGSFTANIPTSNSNATFSYTSSNINVATVETLALSSSFKLDPDNPSVPNIDLTNTYTINSYFSRVSTVPDPTGPTTHALSFPSGGNGYLYLNGLNGVSDSAPIRSICSLTFWVFYNSRCTAGNNTLVFQAQWWPTYFTDGKLSTFVYYTGIGSAVLTQTTTPTLNTWVHYAIVISDSLIYLYVNGVQDNTSSTPVGWFNYTSQGKYNNGFYIGGSRNDNGMYVSQAPDISNSSNFGASRNYTNFKSNLDDIRVYQSALTSEEVNIIYNRSEIGPKVTIISPGTTIITANQGSTSTYASGTATSTLTINKINTTIGTLSIGTKTYGDAPFALTQPTSNSNATFSYTSSDTRVATISNNTITIIGAGTCIITASQPEITNYTAGTATATLTVNKANPTIGTLSFANNPFSNPTSNSSGTFSYVSSNTNIAYVISSGPSNNKVIFLSLGNVTITAVQNESSNYNSGSTSISLNVSGGLTPQITNFSDIVKSYGDTSFALTQPTSNSSGTFSYTTSNTNVATISGTTITIVSPGTATITATQASSSPYIIGRATVTLTVSKANSPITFGNITKTFGDAAFTVTATSISDGTFSYVSSNTAVATVSDNTINVVGAGICTITASQTETSNYLSSVKSATLTVNKVNPTIGSLSIPNKTYGNTPFTVTAPSSNSDGLFSYTSSNTAVATISDNTINVVGAGSCSITAVQAETSNYLSSGKSATLTVSKVNPTYGSFLIPNKTYGNTPFIVTAPSSNSDGLFSYTSSNTAVASISDNTITVVGAGTCFITADQAETSNYKSSGKSATLTVSKANAPITFENITKTFGDATFTVTATSISDGTFSYVSSNTAVATVSNNTITIVGAGICTVTASQAETSNYLSSVKSATLTVNKATPALTGFSFTTKTYGDTPFTVTAPSSNSDGLFSYVSSNTAVATVSNNTINVVGAGICTVTASQAETSNYLSSVKSATLTVNKVNPTIGSLSIPNKTYGNTPFTVTAPSSNSDGLFSYTSSNTAVATISDNTINVVGAGTCSITAVQAETSNYLSSGKSATLTVSKVNPTYGSFLIPNKTYGNTPFIVTAPSSNSDGLFSYTSSNTAVASISDNTITVVGAGTCFITADQAETSNYKSSGKSATLTVSKANAPITFENITKTFGDATFTVTATSISDGTFSYVSSNTAVATVSNNTITIVGAGICTVTSSQAETSNYLSSVKSATLTVNKATPALTGFSFTTKTYGDTPFTVTAPSSNSDGLFSYVSSNTSVATVSNNTINVVGAGICTVTASQAETSNYLSSVKSATLTVNKATPALTGFSVTTKTYGDTPFTVTAPSSNSDGTFSYVSSNTAVATVSNNTITIVGAGTCTLTASQTETSNYLSSVKSATLTVSKANAPITFGNITKTFRDAAFTVTATSISDGTFSYVSSDTSVATVSDNTITIVGAGTCTLTSTQASTNNYISGETTASFTVNKATPIINDININLLFSDPISTSNGTFSYTTSDTNIAYIYSSAPNNNTLVLLEPGNCTITTTQSETSNFTSGIKTQSFTVNSNFTPKISNFLNILKNSQDIPFQITQPTSNSNGAFSYTSSNTNVATISGDIITIRDSGTSIITATQSQSSPYIRGIATTTLTVIDALTTTLTGFSISNKSFGDIPFTVTEPSSNRSGLFSYTSSNTAVATVSNNTITIVGVGTCTVTATQASTINYGIGTATATLTVSKANAPITFGNITKTFRDAAFTVTATSISDGTFSYTSSDTSVATVSNNTITIVGAGTCTVTASQTETSNYLSSVKSATLTVSKANAPITFGNITNTFGNAPFIINATSDSSGAFSYTSSDTSVGTVSNNTITIVGAGTCTLTATQASTNNYISDVATATFTVNKLNPNITGFSISNKIFGDSPFIVSPSSYSDGIFSYVSSNTAVATVSDNTITIIGAGTCTVTATQASTNNYNSRVATATFTVNKAFPPVTFGNITKTFRDAAFTVTATSISDGTFSYVSSNTAVATVSDNTITIVGAGICTITASQTETSNYLSSVKSATLTVSKANAPITFENITKTFRDAAFTVTATSISDGTFSYVSSNTAVATVSDNTITIIGSGICTITASQTETSNYLSSVKSATLTVSKANSPITFGNITKTFRDAAFTVTATSISNGTFSYVSSNTTVATVSDNTITIVGAGICTITATQAASENYSITSETAILTVSKANAPITFGNITKTFRDAAFTVTATSISDGTFSYVSSNTAVATVSDNTITIVGAGICTITASQTETSNYLSGSTIASFTVSQANPSIVDFPFGTKIYGDPPFLITQPISNSNGPFTYTSSNTNVATISDNTITIVGAGNALIRETQSEVVNYNSGIETELLIVNKANPVLGTFSIPTKTFGNIPFTITAPSSNSDGAFSYVSSDTTIATISDNTITIFGAGTCTVTVTQEETSNYLSRVATTTFTVNKENPNITGFSIYNKTFGDSAFTVSPSSDSSGAFSYVSSDTSVATVSDNTITIVGGGICTITASQTETSNYLSSVKSATLTVSKANAPITFGNITKTFRDAAFTVTATSISNGTFSYVSSDTSVATVSNNTITIVGAGICTITATQAASENYGIASETATLTVSKANAPITFGNITKTFRDPAFTVTATSISDGTFSYVSSNTTVATVSNNTINIVGAGTCTVTATQSSTNNYISGETTASFTVSKAVPNITGFSISNKTFGDSPFTVSSSSDSSGAFSYVSSDTSVATLSNNTITIVGGGTCTVTATQSSTNNYISGETTASFTVSKAVPNITGFSISNKTFGDSPFTVSPSSDSSGAFSYVSSDTSVATVSNNTITIVGAGTCTVTATQASTNNYISDVATASFTVSKAVPNITGFSISNKTFGDSPFTVSPSSDSVGIFSYTSSDTSVATVSNNTITIVGAGTCTVTATQASTNNYISDVATASFTVNKASPNITGFFISNKTFGDSAFAIDTPSSDSSGAFSYTSADTSVATVSNNTITIIGAGTCTVTATQSSTNNYISGETTTTFTVNALNIVSNAKPIYQFNRQEPKIKKFSMPTKIFGDDSFEIVPPKSENNSRFSYESSDTSVATISDNNKVNIIKPGKTEIIATQNSSPYYTSATTKTTFEIQECSETNPVIINDGEQLLSFIDKEAKYGKLKSDVIIDKDLNPKFSIKLSSQGTINIRKLDD